MGCTLVRAQPETGRLHQIRVHFSALGHPLLGDLLYVNEGRALQKADRSYPHTDEDRQSPPVLNVLSASCRAALTFPHPP